MQSMLESKTPTLLSLSDLQYVHFPDGSSLQLAQLLCWLLQLQIVSAGFGEYFGCDTLDGGGHTVGKLVCVFFMEYCGYSVGSFWAV